MFLPFFTENLLRLTERARHQPQRFGAGVSPKTATIAKAECLSSELLKAGSRRRFHRRNNLAPLHGAGQALLLRKAISVTAMWRRTNTNAFGPGNTCTQSL
jgi:hypothetical protein